MRNPVQIFVVCGLMVGVGGVDRARGESDSRAAALDDYWNQGTAEITSYSLEQARYGEVHEGQAVLIFVTEDFSRSKHVKLDNPLAAGTDSVKILKLNFTKKFSTGLYPYSMMTSVFSPLDSLTPLKVTTSSQEWCGHTFTQMNRTDAGYAQRQFSYFEGEGDETAMAEETNTEDGLWTTIRLDPGELPTGSIELIPGSMYLRLSHQQWGSRPAVGTLEPLEVGSGLLAYTVEYPDLDRTLTIRFEEAFPHRIEGWEETYRSGWGSSARRLTTRAERKKRIQTDYWTKNRVVDAGLRQRLELH